jgi:hypothetical protein
MNGEASPRGGKLGAVFVAMVIAGSAAGVLGWYFMTNRKGIEIDARGFDVAAVTPQRTTAAAPGPASQPVNSMMVKSDANIRIVDANSSVARTASSSAPGDQKGDAKGSFARTARKYEGNVRDYATRMTKKYPSVRQYGRDWMSYPDLRKLNDDYMRNHDPVAFMAGLSRSPNFGKMVSKYAADPGLRSFVIDGVQQAPGELVAAAGDALQGDGVMKNLVLNVANAMGLPPSITAIVGGSMGSVDPGKMASGLVNGNPQLQRALQQQQAPPVQLQSPQ